MVNVDKLRGRMVECHVSAGALANALGMNRGTLYRKFNGGGDSFTVAEVDRIADCLSLSPDDLNNIFFASDVARYAT